MSSPFKEPETIEDWKLIAESNSFLKEQSQAEYTKLLRRHYTFRQAVFKLLVRVMELTE